MGSYRTPGARTATQGEYRHESFGSGEFITYWKVLPHSVQAAITSAATEAKVDTVRKTMNAIFDPGKAAMARLRLGIIDWTLRDENDIPVQWDPSRAGELIDGLPADVVSELGNLIGSGAPTLEGEQGEASGESSDSSSTDSPDPTTSSPSENQIG